MTKFEARHKIQKNIYNEIGKLGYRSDLDVSKMYWKSKKNVYGIDNELHLVEQVQNCMKILFKSSFFKRLRTKTSSIYSIWNLKQPLIIMKTVNPKSKTKKKKWSMRIH